MNAVRLDGRRSLFDTVLVGISIDVNERLASQSEYLNDEMTLWKRAGTMAPPQRVWRWAAANSLWLFDKNGIHGYVYACMSTDSSCACAE